MNAMENASKNAG